MRLYIIICIAPPKAVTFFYYTLVEWYSDCTLAYAHKPLTSLLPSLGIHGQGQTPRGGGGVNELEGGRVVSVFLGSEGGCFRQKGLKGVA